MTEEQYIPLIHKSLTDQVSEAEVVRLQEWLVASPQNQEIYSQIVESWEIAERFELPINVDIDHAFDKFKTATHGETTAITTKSSDPVRRLWPTISAIAAIGLLLIGVIWAWQTTQSSSPDLVETTATTPRTLVTLPDQSVVTLNQGAKISYNPDFTERKIQLDGEAFFEVTKNPEKPFTILTKNTTTTVLGTSFNIKNEALKTIVTVFTGKVSFADRARKNGSLILTPTQRGIYQSDQQKISKEEQIALETINWQRANIAYQDQALSQILPALETFYGVTIELNEPTLNNCTFTGTFKRAALKDALEALAFSMNLTFTQENNQIVLKGEGCPATTR